MKNSTRLIMLGGLRMANFAPGLFILIFMVVAGADLLLAQNTDSDSSLDAVPWGVASSSGSIKDYAEWFPKIRSAGICWARMFPEWRSVEPTEGAWRWDSLDAILKSAAENRIQMEAILMGATPWTKDPSHAFPMNNLGDWSSYVFTSVDRYKNQVRFWEVWNEGNGGFNDKHDTTADYASLVTAAYTAAKKADPRAQVGMTVASFDAPYLLQAILAQGRGGHSGCFDYLCIHPYEIADGLARANGEIPFLWMSQLLRDALAVHAPDRRNAEIWITEVSRRIENRNGISTTEADAARALVKIYTMALAQGIRRTMWFEARDPVGEDRGFGLMDREGAPRKTFDTMKWLTACFGDKPAYEGWLALGTAGKGYGLLFRGASGPVLVAWMTSGEVDETTTFKNDVVVMDPVTSDVSMLKSGKSLTLTDSPVMVANVPADLQAEAKSNSAKSFPWGGDYSNAPEVSVQFGSPEANHGVFSASRRTSFIHQFSDGSTGLRMEANQSSEFYVHPSFSGLLTNDYYVRITVRRVGKGNVGMNLFYEVADSQGQAAYRNKGEWFSLSEEAGWQTHTWHMTDACFSKMWGYDFSFRPEKSEPFVIGKVEVSKAPFH